MREHKKSRRGCVRCKQRRVKCDESLPSCQRCSQRQELCSYGAKSAIAGPSLAHSGQHTPQPPLSDSQSYLIDMDLTHQYLTSTYSTLWGSEIGKLVWRDNVFQMALTTPAVLAGLLATAAMHRIAVSGTSPELEDIALRKQTQVLERLQQLVRAIDADNCDEVFALSMLVSFWSLASRTLPRRLSLLSTDSDAGNSSPQSTVNQFIQVIRRIKPLRAVTRESQPWLQRGRLAGLLHMPQPEELPELSEDTRRALNELEHDLQESTALTTLCTGDHPAFTVEFTFRMSKRPDLSEMLVAWPAQLSEKLIEGLGRRDDAALLLLAYWAVCFDKMDDRWWSSGWSKDLVREISTVVHGRWRELVQWPCQRLGI